VIQTGATIMNRAIRTARLGCGVIQRPMVGDLPLGLWLGILWSGQDLNRRPLRPEPGLRGGPIAGQAQHPSKVLREQPDPDRAVDRRTDSAPEVTGAPNAPNTAVSSGVAGRSRSRRDALQSAYPTWLRLGQG
jgi:hypothetical protein